MEPILIYLFKTSILLSLFYLVYYFLLKRDTFFTANRYFFLLGIIFSLCLPFLEFTTITYIENTSFLTPETNSFSTPIANNNPSEKVISETTPINWWQIGFSFYGIGTLLFFIRFVTQILSLKKLLNKKENQGKSTFNFIEIKHDIAPFSFFNAIVYNPSLHSSKELDMILAHEKIHARQYHTMDLLLANLMLIFQWINPFAWLYKKSLEQNLEFIADKGALNEISSTKAYQFALVNVSSNNYSTITNNFYQSLIKKRILMLNKQPSKKKNLVKFVFILPLLSLFLWSFNTKEIIEYKEADASFSQEIIKTKSGELKIEIKKENTREELEDIAIALKKKHNVKLNFDLLEYTNNLISKINISIENESGHITSYNDSDSDESIPNILITLQLDEDKKVKDAIFKTIPKGFTYKQEARIQKMTSSLHKLGENPIYIVNNKEYRKSELVGQAFLVTKGIELLLDTEAKDRYGSKAQDGVLIFNDAQKVNTVKESFDIFQKSDNTVGEFFKITKTTPEYGFFPKQKLKQPQDSIKPRLGSLSKDITKESTIEELTEFKGFIKKHFNVDFEFSDVTFKNNLITAIKMQYKDAFGNQETYKTNNEYEFIKPIVFQIKVDKDGKTEEIGFFTPKTQVAKTIIIDNGENARTLWSLGEKPIFIINGKQHQKSDILEKTFLTSEAILVYLDTYAIAKYGDIGKDGVVVIENAIPMKSMTTKIDDEYRKKHKKAHLISMTNKGPELGFYEF
ncbi:M56 family metallopeptidase [Aquimarina sp. 2304DJ70-9]|uniref:M56 family metallopeptidase n=1 Tax=Aquimarina penaris TaxID=3231044 RepID=UPI003462E6C0